MKAVVFQGEGRLEIRDYPDPVPGPDEAFGRLAWFPRARQATRRAQIMAIPPFTWSVAPVIQPASSEAR